MKMRRLARWWLAAQLEALARWVRPSTPVHKPVEEQTLAQLQAAVPPVDEVAQRRERTASPWVETYTADEVDALLAEEDEE